MSLVSQGRADVITAIANLTIKQLADIESFLLGEKRVPLPATTTSIKALLTAGFQGSTVSDANVLSYLGDIINLVVLKKLERQNIISLTDTTWTVAG